tara:strand:- start:281 stop:1453 length:1173 start_codon:yes stop_codon:yes gene_type:complete
MSLFKFAYVRGAQNALVSSGAMESYESEGHADLAVKLAALYIPDSMETMTEDHLASAMSSMVKKAELSLDPKQAMALMGEDEGPAEEASEALSDAAEASSSQAAALLEAAQALEAASDAGIGDEEAARMVVAHLKAANSAAADPDASVLGGSGKGGVKGEKEHDGRKPEAYHLDGKKGPMADAMDNAGHEVAVKKLTEGADLDAKTAAAILRKLSASAAMGSDASAVGGSGVDETLQNDGREEGAYNLESQGPSKTVQPVGHEVEVAGEPDGEKLPKQAAYNFLLAKTAEEVGAFLPYGLNQQEKLAALRTMMGMSNPERAEYISRIKLAMEEGSEDKDDKDDEDKYKGMPEGLRKALMKKEEGKKDDNEDKDDSEKEAAYILRQLGLGV